MPQGMVPTVQGTQLYVHLRPHTKSVPRLLQMVTSTPPLRLLFTRRGGGLMDRPRSARVSGHAGQQ